VHRYAECCTHRPRGHDADPQTRERAGSDADRDPGEVTRRTTGIRQDLPDPWRKQLAVS
jgi:hypothetical protein